MFIGVSDFRFENVFIHLRLRKLKPVLVSNCNGLLVIIDEFLLSYNF